MRSERNFEAEFRAALRLCVGAFFAIGLAMMWLWDTMSRQSCATHPQTVAWKGIHVCASAAQAWLWHIGCVALIVVILAPLGTRFFVKARRRKR